jgi:hypothetical protein
MDMHYDIHVVWVGPKKAMSPVDGVMSREATQLVFGINNVMVHRVSSLKSAMAESGMLNG